MTAYVTLETSLLTSEELLIGGEQDGHRDNNQDAGFHSGCVEAPEGF